MWPDRGERKVSVLAPGKKPIASPKIRAARVGVADIGGEELDIAPSRLVTEIGN
jgi:hypothetical protein